MEESEEEERVGELVGELEWREAYVDAGLSVTQPNDPRSGGHFALGASKAPLLVRGVRRAWVGETKNYEA